MSRTTREPEILIPAPEPNVTPDQLLERARALKPLIRADADAAENAGTTRPSCTRRFATPASTVWSSHAATAATRWMWRPSSAS